ncbi:MAG: hypothetical protein R3304_00465 [Longimicrobiales bacterium]|nr:hypothetical protein [Longimicrobiales bacterium]
MRANPSRRSVVFAVALTLGLAGCASAGGSAARPEGATANRIVRAELEPLGQISPIRAIERLRPRWLNSRSGSPPILHIDGARRGSISDLEAYQISDIQQMEYMSASDATTRFGTGYDGGAILVTTIR